MLKITFLGQGRMGVPMARRLADAGYQLTIWNRTREKCAWAAAADVRVADTPAEAAQGADLVITMVRDADAVAEVLFGEQGAARELAPDTLVVEMSTIGPAAVGELRRRLRPDIRLVDAPVVGSVPQATAGNLQILVGGTDADIARCGDVLAVLGSVTHLGTLCSGAAGKLIVNMITITSFAVIGEALALGDRLDLTTERTLGLLGMTAMDSFVERIRDRIGNDEFPTYFALGLAEKDLALVLDVADATASRIVAAARDYLAAAVQGGLDERDVSRVIEEVRSRGSALPAERR